MTYQEAVRWLLTLGRELASPQQSHVQKFDLENMHILCELLGQPHLARPCAHVAGTNGKGSTSAMIESILRASGLRTGLYTSPHLERINERIRINGEPVSDAEFAASFLRIHTVIEAALASGELRAHPTFFECVTAMAFETFARDPIDFAVYEVGLGGRLDSTNIVRPEVAIITQIDFDHENFLGHSIEQIAGEKAGIIKPGAWVVSAAERPEARKIIAKRCEEHGARLVEVDVAWKVDQVTSTGGCYRAVATPAGSDESIVLDLPLPGRFQLRNALTAATAARLLAERGFPISAEAIGTGIHTVRWPGRLERVSDNPAVFLDGTHNPAGARELLAFWNETFAGKRIFLVYGAMRDKAVDEVADILFPRTEYVIFTEPGQSRAISAPLLAEMTAHLAHKYQIVREPVAAIEAAIQMAGPEDAVFVAGSLYLVGELASHIPAANAKR